MPRRIVILMCLAFACDAPVVVVQAATPLPTPIAAAVPASAATVGSVAPAPPTLAPIVVSAANTEPHIWTFQKGNSKVLVLGTVYPEPKGLDFIPYSINRAVSESGAVIGPPWFDFSTSVSVFHPFHAISLWRESRHALYLPDGKHLADVLPPDLLQRWQTLKADYLPHNDKVNGMLPMYAGWKLYDAVLDHSGVAVKSSVASLINEEAERHDMSVTDAAFHWTIKDTNRAAKAFKPDPQASVACLKTILDSIQGLPDASRTMASAWARGDVSAMQAYLRAHIPTPRCWEGITNKAVASVEGLDLKQRERSAWLAAIDAAAAKHPVIFTTAPMQDIFDHTGRIGWLLSDGYIEAAAAGSAHSISRGAGTAPGH